VSEYTAEKHPLHDYRFEEKKSPIEMFMSLCLNIVAINCRPQKTEASMQVLRQTATTVFCFQ